MQLLRRGEKMIKNAYRYITQLFNWKQFLKDTGNNFTFTGQRPSHGKVAGVIVTLQMNEDNSDPIIDRETGEIKENNYLEVIEVTIVDATYPLAFTKGDKVSLDDFRQDLSYYIKYNLVLRCGKIYPYQGQETDAANQK